MAPVEYSYAFQPIVDTESQSIKAYEALVRGPAGESAWSVLQQFSGDDLLRFDGAGRLRAISMAADLGIECELSLNLLTDSLDLDPSVLDQTVEHAESLGIPAKQLIFEVSETEAIANPRQFLEQVDPLRGSGVKFSLDDFGAGYSGLNLLAEFQPDTIKLDLTLVRDIHRKGARQAIIRGVLCTCEDLGIDVVAEGVECVEEYDWLWLEGVRLFQGYLFAKPAFGELPTAQFPL